MNTNPKNPASKDYIGGVLSLIILVPLLLFTSIGAYYVIDTARNSYFGIEWYDVLSVIALILISLFLLYLIYIAIMEAFAPGCIEEYEKEIPVKIESVEYEPAHTTYTYNGKSVTPLQHSERYEVHVSFDDSSDIFYNEKLYRKYKDNIGAWTTGTLRIRKFKNGKTRTELISIV